MIAEMSDAKTTTLVLDPLGTVAVRQVIVDHLHLAPDDSFLDAVAAADGVAFYLVEFRADTPFGTAVAATSSRWRSTAKPSWCRSRADWIPCARLGVIVAAPPSHPIPSTIWIEPACRIQTQAIRRLSTRRSRSATLLSRRDQSLRASSTAKSADEASLKRCCDVPIVHTTSYGSRCNMRLPNAAQGSRPWRIRDIASDFTLEDVWALPVHAAPTTSKR